MTQLIQILNIMSESEVASCTGLVGRKRGLHALRHNFVTPLCDPQASVEV
jgi:hypothetical protein